MESKPITVRIPPSPTGFFHVGRARTALFNYLFAKKLGGKIVFRIEDTDKERSKKEYEEDIIESLEWLGITYDEGPFRQSERGDIYAKYIQKMLKNGSAYISQEDEGQNKEVIRFKNPNVKITFKDLIRGDISVETGDLGDFVIARNIDDPLYHLTVVADDFEMGVTHIIRGDDGIANTPRQILIQEAIGAPRPIYAHVPLILAPDKSKMSARHGAVSVRDFRTDGYLSGAMVNFLGLLGFNPGGDREIYSLTELTDIFDLERVQKGGGVFNIEKLNWMNREYILKETKETQIENLKKWSDGKFTEKLLPIIIDWIHRWSEVKEISDSGEFDYFFESPKLDPEKIGWKGESKETTKENLKKVLEILDSEKPAEKIMKLAEQIGKGSILWPLRYALSGREKSPDPFTLLDILGAEEAKKRISYAIETL